MEINALYDWLKPKSKPLLIAGPCSVESEEQMMRTADSLARTGLVSAFRGGVWKPRTKPGSFEGIGSPALKWLKAAGTKHQIPVITEVANARHVEEALEAGIDMLWIGARTTVNPFYVQDIADALKGTDIPVLVKNPIHPEVKLWLGALERLNNAGIQKLGAIHRGFYAYQSQPFRNEPKWEVFFELRRLAPDLPVICDPSHIAGRSELIGEVCQSALDLGMDGFMIESHIEPHKALSDPLQQLRPYDLDLVYRALEHRDEAIDDERYIAKLEELRYQIDKVDAEILKLISRRQELAKAIGPVKYENQATIFQMKRWFKVLENRKAQGLSLDLEDELVHELFQLLHKYSIDTQIKNHHE
ncbi:chorismate mutase [Croceimicrobium hydrocarbonivorans]|uniref:chorismate mutase n=1 Tax=Croceimicrobium hydrocarbonivorans TaxID=2761580 RepID=A0A7H0VI99_9FLAO|nr:chorismate mutase [Croceimicrobium hydrocarbonivorans]QNR25447.1 bifunctional 3-deoxy-7-phosphoheptulonate synthase/chorismate mutase type II [Croceimicrobium hydrocarbonivorans]